MRILISAVACNPYQGSESYFGWSAICGLSRDHELCVLTHSRHQADLERATEEGLVPSNVRFAFAGDFKPWHPNRLLARIQSWNDYRNFARDSLRVAKELHRIERFDVVHHVTYTTCRMASPMWQLGIPFVFGPVCGNEEFPFRLFPILSASGAAFELSRKISNAATRVSPGVRRMIRRAAHIFAITEEAELLMKHLRGSSDDVTRLSPGFFSKETAATFSRFASEKRVDGPLRLYVAGNLGGQKCVALAFQALARVKRNGVKFRYHLGAGGPEVPYLKKLAYRLGLIEEIVFGGSMSREAYQRELGCTHIFLLPSMRETVGLTMLEAMLAGCVPVVADNGGPRLSVTPECGYKVPVTTLARMADEIADIVEAIDHDRQIIRRKGMEASKRVATCYSEDHYRRIVNAVYAAVTGRQ